MKSSSLLTDTDDKEMHSEDGSDELDLDTDESATRPPSEYKLFQIRTRAVHNDNQKKIPNHS